MLGGSKLHHHHPCLRAYGPVADFSTRWFVGGDSLAHTRTTQVCAPLPFPRAATRARRSTCFSLSFVPLPRPLFLSS